MMGSIIGMLVGKNIFGSVIGEKAARAIAYVGLALAVAVMLGLGKCAYDRSIIGKHDMKQELKVQKRLQPANDRAANDRAAETITLNTREQEAHDAIHSVPDSAPSAAAVRHNCDRLRRAGKDVIRIPACGGRPGGG
jgi:hypothetical protein